MQQLEALAREAQALAGGAVFPPSTAEAEVARQMQICNACRYCEGYCAVFPVMTRRLEFNRADVHFLANLCHNCGACLHACQYAPPHEFAVNVPRAMAQVRVQTYADCAWPSVLGRLYARNGLTLSVALAAGLALLLHRGLAAPAAGEAVRHTLVLEYLDGGHGQGCNNEDDAWTHARRRFHHLTFYGFLLCFAATSVATLYHYAFGWVAPYGWTSLPKLLGTAGGLALSTGTVGLWLQHRRRHPLQGDPAPATMDLGFIALLFGAGVSGLALALSRGSAAMPLLLCLHLGIVIAFFVTMPYGKFAHGFYRGTALLQWAIERRQPSRLRLGSE